MVHLTRYIKKLKEVKKGDYFKFYDRKNHKVSKTVYVRDYYERSTKKYWCYKFEDTNDGRLFNGDRLVVVDFEF